MAINFFTLLKKYGSNFIKLMIFFDIVLLSACSKTPLQQLASNHLYPSLNASYWAKEQQQKTALWINAVVYCKQNSEKPNCSAVIELYVITNGATQASAIGHSGQTINIPDF